MIRPLDLELLFAAFAFRHAKIDNEQLGRAVAQTSSDHSISDTMVQTGMIDEQQRKQIDAAVKDHLQRHHDDSSTSLAAIEPLPFPLSIFDHLLETQAVPADAPKQGDERSDSENQLVTYETVVSPNLTPHPSLSDRGVTSNTAYGPTRYQSKRFHARGGLGEIFVASDREVHRDVALKEIQPACADNPASRRMFVLEGSLTGSLEHPGVVPVYGMGQYPDGRPFYAMRFIRGESLKQAIKNLHSGSPVFATSRTPSLTLRQLLNRFLDVCNTIDYAHSRGVLHRDIKPDNIMLGPFRETLVVDWGLAAIYRRDSAAPNDEVPGELLEQNPTLAPIRLTEESDDQVLGTAPYMSPEQARGRQSALKPSSDVFSLGATLYTILTGTTMYPGTSTAHVLDKAKRRDAVAPTAVNPNIPNALAAIVEKATASSQTDRYPTAKTLADDLEAWLADEPVTAYRERWHERTLRWMRQHRTLVTSGFAALLVGMFALGTIAIVLSTKNAEVAAQRDTAERNLIAARKAVRESFVQISEDERLKAEGLDRLRMSLLKSPEPYFVEFLSQTPDDPRLRLEQAQWRALLAAIVRNTQSPSQAIEYFQTVEKNLDELESDLRPHAASPSSNEFDRTTLDAYHLLRTQTQVQLASLYAETGKFEESLAHSQRAIEYAEANPNTETALLHVAALTQLGKTQFQIGRDDASLETLNDAIARLDVAPRDNRESWQLAMNHPLMARAEVRAARGNLFDAIEDWKKALKQSEQTTPERDSEIAFIEFRTRCYVSLARETTNARLRKLALEYSRMAQELAQQLVDRHPDNLLFAALQIDANNLRATTLAISDAAPDPNEVRNGLTRAIELDTRLHTEFPTVFEYRYRLLKTRLNLIFAELRTGKEPPSVLKDASDVLAETARLAHDFPQVPDAQALHAKTLINTAMLSLWFQVPDAETTIQKRRSEATAILEHLDQLPQRIAYTELHSNLHELLGQIAQTGERWNDATEQETNRQETMTSFPASYWEVPFPHERRADSFDTRAQYLFAAGKLNEGLEDLQKGIDVRQTLLDTFPDEPVIRKNLATALRDYGDWLRELDVPDVDANQYTLRSLDVLQNVPLSELNDSQLQTIVGDLAQLSIVSSDANDYQTASQQCERARAAAIELYRRDPTLQHMTYQLLVENLLIGYRLELGQDVDALVNNLHHAVAGMLDTHGHDADARDAAMLAYRQTATHFHSKKNYEQARYFLAEAYQLSENSPQQYTIAINLSDAEIRLGRFLSGCERSAPIMEEQELSALSYYSLAVNFALAVAALQNDTHLSESANESLSDLYQSNAMKALEKAAQVGLFNDPGWRSTMEADADLDAIRTTDAFKKWTQALESQEPSASQ
ncbi:protein kinase domain-containing protein [Rhodopirellula sallentina]|uniref:Serine/threonine protein kinase domain protein n=1 Tax=Rhodopirellula sallentina SM41 TaxID=1263870 RepID=M5TWF9_9BACT|nr:protein kinase [Rhodopirellula sallentina]EMI53547.1 Serine/threonine protein kinase domain protein [Rhodopirellula sallentina SM41]